MQIMSLAEHVMLVRSRTCILEPRSAKHATVVPQSQGECRDTLPPTTLSTAAAGLDGSDSDNELTPPVSRLRRYSQH